MSNKRRLRKKSKSDLHNRVVTPITLRNQNIIYRIRLDKARGIINAQNGVINHLLDMTSPVFKHDKDMNEMISLIRSCLIKIEKILDNFK